MGDPGCSFSPLLLGFHLDCKEFLRHYCVLRDISSAPDLTRLEEPRPHHRLVPPSFDPYDHFPCRIKALDNKTFIVKLFSIGFMTTRSWISSWSGPQPAWKDCIQRERRLSECGRRQLCLIDPPFSQNQPLSPFHIGA